MEHRAQGSAVVSQTSSQEMHCEGRGTWVLTAYGIAGLALFGVLLYFFATYVTN